MIPLTPLITKYKDSFLLYAFRHMDQMSKCQYPELTEILVSEMTYLYNIACIITFKEVYETEIEQLKNWALNLNKNLELEQMKLEFENKMVELNLRSFIPKDYTYSYETIWDTMHFMAIVIDDIIDDRQKLTFEFVMYHLHQMKTFYFNIFVKLQCIICRNHYQHIRGILIGGLERIEICLNRERYGEAVLTVDAITPDNITQNAIMKHGLLYLTMVLHDHINQYKYIQLNAKPSTKAFRMKWSHYKNKLELN
ncbi:sulfhydryl oxidase [Orgyia pseudotsugata single capsid nuclopolyhedrovirus]|nr:sulfhydryl oxidase [Orgyia pseudotsugata single capsid nuclopolyhedrovirus]